MDRGGGDVDHRDPRVAGSAAAARGLLQLVERQQRRRVRFDRGRNRYRCQVRPAGARSVPSAPPTCQPNAEGARTGIRELGPTLLGLDPCELDRVNLAMDRTLKGHPYVKSALDMACWDLLGKAAGLPVTTLMGGRHDESFALYRAISQEAPAAMADKVAGYRREGYRKFQLKVGGEVEADIARIKDCAAMLGE